GRRAVLEAGDTFGLARGIRWFHDAVEIPAQTNTTLVIGELALSDAGTYTAICDYGGGVERTFEVARLTVPPAPAAGRIVSWGYTNSMPGIPISTMQDAVGLAMGDNHALALRADGRVFQWGYNGPLSSLDIWRSLEPVVAVSAKGSGAAVLGASGRAASDTWSYCNPCGALETNRFVDVAFGGEFAIGLRNDGTAIGWGINGSGQASVPATLQGLVAVAAGAGHAMALRNNGTVAVWGSNDYGQTNVPAGLSDVKAIACGWGHCLALRSNGVVVAWGQNSSGQRNVPGGLAGVVAIGAGPVQSFAVRSNGSVVAWGDNQYGQCSPPAGLSNVLAVVGGTYATAALVGSSNNPAILEHPVGGIREIGEAHTFNVRAGSAAPLNYQWQRNGTNIPGAVGASLTLTNLQIADEDDYTVAVSTSVGAGISGTATLLINPPPFLSLPSTRGRLVVWGGLQYGGGLPTVLHGLGEVAAISAGPNSFSSFAIRSDGTARAWNALFSFVIPDTNLVSIVPWGSGYLGLRANGVVGAWGPDGVEAAPPPGLRDVVQLVGEGSGGYIAVRSDGSIRHNYLESFFPTNQSRVVQAALGRYHGALLLEDGTVALSQLGHPSEQTPVPIGLGNVVQVAAGAQHTLALGNDGTVFAWGRTIEGQCAVPAGVTNAVAVAAGQNFSMALRADGAVVVWGDESQGQRLIPPGLTNVAAIAAGFGHCLALQRGPVLIAPPTDLNVAPGQTATFQALAQGSAPLRYQWSFRGEPLFGATNSSLNVVAALQTEGLYSVNVSNNEGASSADAMLWLGLPPEILAHPEGGFIPVGASKSFMVLASGLGPLRYQWQSNGTNVIGATNSVYGIFGAATNRSGDYRVVVTNLFGATTSQVARLTVITAPTVVIQPASLTRAEGENAPFAVVTAGGQPQSYQWRFNGSILPGQTNTSLLVANVRTNDAGAYSVQVSNLVGSATSANAILTVVAPPPRFVVAPSNQVASFGSDVRWDVVTTGASPLGYQWYFNNVALPGAGEPSLLITNVDSNLAGSYQVVVSNAFGSITSTPAQLTLRVGPNVVIWGTNDFVRAVPADLTNAVAISASKHVLALRDDSTVLAWGWNDQGQTAVPAGLSNVVAVSAGSGHSLALRNDGHVFAWGGNSFGEASVPSDLTNGIAIAAGSSHSLALRTDGTVVGWGYNAYGQASPPAGLSNVVGVTANEGASLAVKRDGTVVRWGNGYFPPPGLSNVTQVMGRARMLALRSDGRVVGWDWASGGAVEGPAGVVTADSYSAPYFVPPNSTYLETHEIGLLTNGTVAVWGTNRGGVFTPPPGLSNVSALSAGYFFNAAIVGGPTIIRQPQDIASAVGTAVALEVHAIGRSPLQY
ncbi:MAG TPA: immunoglobulin domain-containing protein, partial [Verrucomicrobiae bacterium]|nr:immunoglobulin domain-containing protein [Verrucomicrobiae bacterium]